MYKPGDKVIINRVDPYGLVGRDDWHPPVAWEDQRKGQAPTSPCDGKVAYIVSYQGWESDAGDVEMVEGDWRDPRDPGNVFNLAAAAADKYNANPPNPGEWLNIIHFYRAVVPGIGVFDFADYELKRMVWDVELPHSEVCMHMGVAGERVDIELLENNMAQIWFKTGQKFSAPITRGEAGVPYDSDPLMDKYTGLPVID